MPRNSNPASRYSLSNAKGEGDLTFDITPQTTMADPADYGRDMLDNIGHQLPANLRAYFDYESYGRDCLSDYSEHNDHYFSI